MQGTVREEPEDSSSSLLVCICTLQMRFWLIKSAEGAARGRAPTPFLPCIIGLHYGGDHDHAQCRVCLLYTSDAADE